MLRKKIKDSLTTTSSQLPCRQLLVVVGKAYKICKGTTENHWQRGIKRNEIFCLRAHKP